MALDPSACGCLCQTLGSQADVAAVGDDLQSGELCLGYCRAKAASSSSRQRLPVWS